jgi:hypothetical protein
MSRDNHFPHKWIENFSTKEICCLNQENMFIKVSLYTGTEDVNENILAVMCLNFLKNMQWFVDSVSQCVIWGQVNIILEIHTLRHLPFSPNISSLHVWLGSIQHLKTVFFAPEELFVTWQRVKCKLSLKTDL